MHLQSLVGKRMTASESGRGEGALGISTKHQLVTESWTADVAELERAIGRFQADADVATTCEVVFFEMAGDRHLHCNVTHHHATKTITGWAGPGRVPDGFVHNRRFGDEPLSDILQHVRAMVFAARM